MDTAFETLSQDLSDIITKTSRAVVSIRGQRCASTGIHWRKGLIITSCEALYSESSFKVSLPNGETFETELMGSDPTTDIAVLSLPEDIELPTVVLGDAQTLMIGQLVSTVGYAAGGSGRQRGRRRRGRGESKGRQGGGSR
ncbi:MAG: trypsin-like peptidase domain-containing protein, partial [Cyanobacteria bacterium J06576_12]